MTWTAEQRAEAVGLALSVGDKAAAKQLGIPRRTVTHWRGHASDPYSPDAVIITRSREDVAAKVWAVFVDGIDALAERVKDPKTRAGDLARIVDVLGERYALLMGGPTANVAMQTNRERFMDDMTDEERRILADALDAELARHRIEGDDHFIADTVARLQDDPLGIPADAIARLIQTIELRVSGRDPKFYPDLPEEPDADPE